MAATLQQIAGCSFGRGTLRRKRLTKCRAAMADLDVSGASKMNLTTAALNALFSYKPFFRFAAGRARQMIMERGTKIGYPWEPELTRLKQYNWDSELEAVQDKSLLFPEYYLKPFHAYEKGNLSWDAALEVELAAKSVHANLFDPERKKLDPDGDVKMRDSYHDKMLPLLRVSPKSVLDIGCATGLSTFSLSKVFPQAEVVGVDLSPFFVSVANFKLKEAEIASEKRLPLRFLHAAGESTGLPSGSFDLVSICLVCHELPRHATKQIIEEANRVLKAGGALSIMEMNPYSASLQRMVDNIFAFTAFKATEPYFDDYRTFQIETAIQEYGFSYPVQVESSPNHRTIVAHKLGHRGFVAMAAAAKLAPLLDRVLIERFVPAAKSMGGVLLPESMTKYNSGTVVATGQRRLKDGSLIPLSVKEGDKVLLPEHGGKEVKLGKKEYMIYREEELLGILHDDTVVE